MPHVRAAQAIPQCDSSSKIDKTMHDMRTNGRETSLVQMILFVLELLSILCWLEMGTPVLRAIVRCRVSATNTFTQKSFAQNHIKLQHTKPKPPPPPPRGWMSAVC